MKLKANYHTHTSLCDGTASPEEMVLEALRKGFDHLGFSGHVDIHPQMDVPAYQQEIRSLAKKFAGEIEILCGGELDSLYRRSSNLIPLIFKVGPLQIFFYQIVKPCCYFLR